METTLRLAVVTRTSSSKDLQFIYPFSLTLGRAIVVIVGVIAQLERNLIIERVRAGMRRAKLQGRQIGRRPLDVDRAGILGDRARGVSLSQVAQGYGISRAMVSKIIRQAKDSVSHKGDAPASS